MRLLVINPNATASMTEKIAIAARAAVPAGVEVTALTNHAGPASIQGPADGLAATAGLLDLVRGAQADAIVIACFDDTALAEARALDLPIAGLMCIPPVDEEPSLHFALLAKMAARNGLTGLSMGMSGDFESAIALGATHVRIGAAIFGERVAG